MKRVPLSPMVIFCNADSYIAFPASPWMDASEVEMTRETLEARNMPASNAMTVTIGVQTCEVPSAVDGAVGLTASRTTDGLTFPVAFADRTATTGAKQLARFVYLAKNTTASDTTVRFAWVSGVVKLQKK